MSLLFGDINLRTLNGDVAIQDLINTPVPVWNGVTFTDVEVISVNGLGDSKIVEITMANGSVIKCTGDQLFALADQSLCGAANLTSGCTLRPWRTPNGGVDVASVQDVRVGGFFDNTPIYELREKTTHKIMVNGIVIPDCGVDE